MDSILPHIIDLKSKINLLASKHGDLIEKNISLKKENVSLGEKVNDLKQEIEELKKRIEVVDLTKGISVRDSNSIGFARKRVNNLIREIDKCISLLNN